METDPERGVSDMLPGYWIYETEHGKLLCKCQKCEGRLALERDLETNPYNYCPYCGWRLFPGRFAIAHKKVYGNRHIEGTKPIGWSDVPMTAENK